MRVYVAADSRMLEQLAGGSRITAPTFLAASEDEEDEYAALGRAAEHGEVVIAAEVDSADEGLSLADVAAFHVGVDGSDTLAWFATQELDAVLRELRNSASG